MKVSQLAFVPDPGNGNKLSIPVKPAADAMCNNDMMDINQCGEKQTPQVEKPITELPEIGIDLVALSQGNVLTPNITSIVRRVKYNLKGVIISIYFRKCSMGLPSLTMWIENSKLILLS